MRLFIFKVLLAKNARGFHVHPDKFPAYGLDSDARVANLLEGGMGGGQGNTGVESIGAAQIGGGMGGKLRVS